MTKAALAFLIAGSLAFAQEKAKDARTAIELTDSKAGSLGGFVADTIDMNPAVAECERNLLAKIEDLQKARGEKKDDPATGKKKGKRKGRKAKQPSGDIIKNGLTEPDRQALGKFVVTQIKADLKAQVLVDAIKKELDRLRAERVKASAGDTSKKKRSDPKITSS